ncbi:hypothetical protein B0T17DRAFT_532752 [Bombardia bombarda]|uniref:Uncharacterized protein n=1 Tax=Bombardia bombarda TaxID=252184 RepID=A0AA39X1A3_9PEZI|nr:hypothetical protein B0T17DRAFT_532752 [Bombardia bombarda]
MEAEQDEREEERAAYHKEYLASIKKKKKSSTASPVGSYIVDCDKIEDDWPDLAEDMTADIYHTDKPGVFAATFDFGVLEGMMLISSNVDSLRRYELGDDDEDEDEDEGEQDDNSLEDSEQDEVAHAATAVGSKRKSTSTGRPRGRPPKNPKVVAAAAAATTSGRPRGRPPKNPKLAVELATPTTRPRGRPPKNPKTVAVAASTASRPRGRPPKNSKTVAAAAAAAAASNSIRPRGRPAKKAKAATTTLKYAVLLKCSETGEGQIYPTAEKGTIEFDGPNYVSFTGTVGMPCVGASVVFTARKVADIAPTARATDSWENYSEAAYEHARVSRWR